jgi:ABC-2 type transport system ATP-binding protein
LNEIIINKISKSYGNKNVLNDVTLSLENGKVYGLIGENGAGKTTLMKILCGILTPDEGELLMQDKNVGALIEEPAAYMNMSAKDNLRIFMNCFSKSDDEKIEAILKLVGLMDTKKKVREYSLGMKKRLGIAISLLTEPNLLILDEPTSGLDITGINETREIVRNYMKNKENIVLISSHDTRDIVELCDEIIFIDKGKIILRLEEFERDSIKLETLYLEALRGGITS